MKSVVGLIGIIITLLILSSCSSQYAYTEWEENVTLRNLEFTKLRYSVHEETKDTSSIIGLLKEAAIVDSIPVAANWIHFNSNWSISLCQLSERFTVHNVEAATASWIIFSDSGSLIFAFPKDTFIQGYQCRGNAEKYSAKGIHTAFYQSGKLKAFYSPEDVEVDGILCKSTLFQIIELHQNGRLRSCKLAKDVMINGEKYRKGDLVRLNESGDVQ
jgi:hypothetical protein